MCPESTLWYLLPGNNRPTHINHAFVENYFQRNQAHLKSSKQISTGYQPKEEQRRYGVIKQWYLTEPLLVQILETKSGQQSTLLPALDGTVTLEVTTKYLHVFIGQREVG